VPFLQAVGARTTVISSGNNESYGHPRPILVGASGRYGRIPVDDKDQPMDAPLVYSTEVARSPRLSEAGKVLVDDDQYRNTPPLRYEPGQVDVEYGGKYPLNLGERPLLSGIKYGLVNVRTDGNMILCATLNEAAAAWEYRVFKAGV
jgi:hypothetical protein